MRPQRTQKLITMIARAYSSTVINPLVASDLFNAQRKAVFSEKVSKLKTKPVNSRVVEEGKIDVLNRAAVLVPLISINGEPGLLFTARSSALRSHAGEISFPGGKFDSKFDKNAEDTALRETEEELGVSRGSFEIWDHLPSLQGRDGKSAITPVIALLKEPLVLSNLRPNHKEVSKVIVCTVAELCQAHNQAYTQFGSGYTLPIYFAQQTDKQLEKPKIWGLTAIITHITLNALVPEMYKLKLPFVKNILSSLKKVGK